MTEILPFTFPTTGQPVRTVLIDGEPWWFASDVCAVLDIANVGNALSRLEADDISSIRLADGTPGNPNRAVVNESALYELVIRSDRPQAKPFRRWVTADVLPTIRRTGSYSVAMPEIPTTYAAALRAAAEQAERADLAEKQVAELEPKAQAHDAFMAAANSDRLVGQVAKDLGWQEKALRGFLLDEHLIFRRQRLCGGWEYDFYAEFRPHFTVTEKPIEHTWGWCNHYTLHVTPRGMDLIRKRIADRRTEVEASLIGGPR